MTEKRFEYIDDDLEPLCKDNENDGEVIHWKKVVDLLNEQQATIEAKDKEVEESKITIQLYEADVSMRDNFLKSKGLYDEFLQCIWTVNEEHIKEDSL